MNPLTHAHFVLELFKDQKLTQDEKDHLIVGSIIPDINISGLIQFQKTHSQGLEFFNKVKSPLHKYFAFGMITHGEEPQGLDFYTHNLDTGYIKNYHNSILKIAKRYKHYIGKTDSMTVHHLIEFSVDNLVAEKNPKIVKQVLDAFQNPKIPSAVTAFSNHLGFSERKNRKIISLLNNRFLLDYFHNFSSPETTSQNWLNLTFYRNLKRSRDLPLREKIKKLTLFSFYNLKRRISDTNITRLFKEINNELRDNIFSFLAKTEKKMNKIKNELIKEINSKKI
ncbi:MAG: hypothetical protein ABIA37_02840 [Candidatus Woesearchaeota archaeon]